jgi:hypothetical protein
MIRVENSGMYIFTLTCFKVSSRQLWLPAILATWETGIGGLSFEANNS